MPYELKPKDIKRRLTTCKQLLQRQKREGFLYRIATGNIKWIHYDNTKRRRSGKFAYALTSAPKPNIHGSKLLLCIWWDQLCIVYHELLKPTETISGDHYRLQLMHLSRTLKKKWPLYEYRHDKGILEPDNGKSHIAKRVKTYLETPKREVVPQPPYSPEVARPIITCTLTE